MLKTPKFFQKPKKPLNNNQEIVQETIDLAQRKTLIQRLGLEKHKIFYIFVLVLMGLLLLFLGHSLNNLLWEIFFAILPFFLAIIICISATSIGEYLNQKVRLTKSLSITYTIMLLSMLIFGLFIGTVIYFAAIQWVSFASKFMGTSTDYTNYVNFLTTNKGVIVSSVVWNDIYQQINISLGNGQSMQFSHLGILYVFLARSAASFSTFFNTDTLLSVSSQIHDKFLNANQFLHVGLISLPIVIRILIIVCFTVFCSLLLLYRIEDIKQWILKKSMFLSQKAAQNWKIAGDTLFSWVKVICVEQIYIFFMVLTLVLLIGNIGHSAIFRDSPIVIVLIINVLALVPLYGLIIGGIFLVSTTLVDFAIYGNFWPLLICVIGGIIILCGEAFLISPIAYHQFLHIYPVTLIIGISLGGALLGVLGMLLAVPSIAIFRNIYNANHGIYLPI